MGIMVRGQMFQLMASGLHDLFVHFFDLKQRDEEFSYVFNIESSDAAFEDEVEFSGLPPLEPKLEGTAVVYRDIIQGGTKRYLHMPWALGVRASWELIKDDQYKLINQAPKCLARSAHFVREMCSWNVLNGGFTSTLVIDGQTLFNTQHPLLGGTAATNIGPGVANIIAAAGTFPNRPATDIDLSFTGIQAAIDQFERLIDSQGLPISIKPRWLVIPPELKWIAREILGSPNKPFVAPTVSTGNEINALIAEDLTFFVSHYLTSASAWFLVSDKDNHTLKFMDRESLEEDFSDDFDTRTIKQIATMRFSTGATTWIGTWGSNGP